jgi:hypothetical protein
LYVIVVVVSIIISVVVVILLLIIIINIIIIIIFINITPTSNCTCINTGYKGLNPDRKLHHNLFVCSHFDLCEVASQVVVADEVVAVDDQ